MLRCSPGQLRHLTDAQIEAVTAVTTDMLPNLGGTKRGAQVFTDITHEGLPEGATDDPMEPDDEPPMKRARTDDVHAEDDFEYSPEISPEDVQMPPEPELQSLPTAETADDSQAPTEIADDTQTSLGQREQDQEFSEREEEVQRAHRVAPYPTTRTTATSAGHGETTTAAGHGIQYGPIRHDLEDAWRRSVDILDHGVVRLPRTQLAPAPEVHDDALEAFVAQTTNGHEVFRKDLTPQEKVDLDRSKLKEWDKLLKTDAIKVFRGKEAEMLRKEYPPERFLESRFVMTRREDPVNPGKSELKCRWCIKGFKDPDILELQRQSPTLSSEGLAVCLQLIASSKWRLVIADVEGAFLQGEPLQRQNGRLFVKIPKEGIPNHDNMDVVEVLKCVYGLVDAPRAWWSSFSQTLRSLGMRQSELDPCLFYWYDDEKLQGCVALHVDDMLIGGTNKFHEVVLSKLKQRYPFKHWKVGSGMFLGRRLNQLEDFSIVCDQKEYAEQVQTIHISKERRRQKQMPVTESERRKLRGVVGAANWMMSNTRPDIAAANAFLQQRIQKAVVSALIEANKLVAKIRDYSHVQVWIRSIPLDEGALLVASDASWANNENLASQAGYMVCFAHQSIKDGQATAMSPLRWKSYKQERQTQSTLGAELMGVSRAIAEAEWIRSLFAEALHPGYDLTKDGMFREKIGMIVTIDNKPIYDHVCGDGVVVKDKRMAIEMLIVRRDIRKNNIVLRWVATQQMLVDCLTKLGASADFLLRCLKEGRYCVCLLTPDKIPNDDVLSSKRGDEKCTDPDDRT